MGQIAGKQLRDGSVVEGKIDSTYAASLLKRDGSVALTGNLDAGAQRLTNLGAPTGASDAARLQDIRSLAWKDNVVVATTANITLSGTQTIDGVAVGVGDRVLVKDQTTTSENGVYVVASGAWARAADADDAGELQNAVVGVKTGTANADKIFKQNADDLTVGTDAITWADITAGLAGAAAINTDNKDMAASATTADGDQATATALGTTPANDGYPIVTVNGMEVTVGDGVKTEDCYFSPDTGTTARSISAIAAGDTLHWVGSVAGYQLETTDIISIHHVS